MPWFKKHGGKVHPNTALKRTSLTLGRLALRSEAMSRANGRRMLVVIPAACLL